MNTAASPAAPPPDTVRLAIGGMTCASCSGRVERALGKVPGVVSATVNLATERATVEVRPGTEPQALVAAVQAASYTAAPVAEGAVPAPVTQPVAGISNEARHVVIAAVLSLPRFRESRKRVNVAFHPSCLPGAPLAWGQAGPPRAPPELEVEVASPAAMKNGKQSATGRRMLTRLVAAQ